MFDVSFSELMLIGVIALIVIGPERLPKVARTIGHLVGRAQRYVSDVKTDIQREMDLDELNSLKGQMEDAARSVKSSMQTASDSLREPLEDARKALTEASASIGNLASAEQTDEQKAAAQEAIAAPSAAAASSTPAGTSAATASPTPADPAAEASTPEAASVPAAAPTPTTASVPAAPVPATASAPAVSPAPAVAPATHIQDAAGEGGDAPEPDTATLPLPGFDDAAATSTKTGKPS